MATTFVCSCNLPNQTFPALVPRRVLASRSPPGSRGSLHTLASRASCSRPRPSYAKVRLPRRVCLESAARAWANASWPRRPLKEATLAGHTLRRARACNKRAAARVCVAVACSAQIAGRSSLVPNELCCALAGDLLNPARCLSPCARARMPTQDSCEHAARAGVTLARQGWARVGARELPRNRAPLRRRAYADGRSLR